MDKILDRLFKEEQRYAGIDKYEYVNGGGIGVTFYSQSCTHHCKGCHNPQTWDKHGGKVFTREIFDDMFQTLSDTQITRLTLSGGDPFDSADLCGTIGLKFKRDFPQKKLWVYTGYTYEELIKKSDFDTLFLLTVADILVDGEYIEEEKDLSLPFRGSRNQRIIDLNATKERNEIVLLDI